MGLLFPIEGDRWMVTVQGVGDDHPPTDDAGFDRFAAGLRSPAIHDAIRDAEPLTRPVAFANTANRRRHYDRARHWPERLIAVGTARARSTRCTDRGCPWRRRPRWRSTRR